MPLWLKALDALAELSLVLSPYETVYSLLQVQSQGVRLPLLTSAGTACIWCLYMQQILIIHIKILKTK